MSAAVDLVERHLAALWRSDWADLARSLSPDIKLQISSGNSIHTELETGGLYRHITQAWDFRPGDVQLLEDADGIVRARMRLTNGHDWVKDVDGEYRVSGGRIDFIHFVDRFAYPTADAPKITS